jgi:hypothetical protein
MLALRGKIEEDVMHILWLTFPGHRKPSSPPLQPPHDLENSGILLVQAANPSVLCLNYPTHCLSRLKLATDCSFPTPVPLHPSHAKKNQE